LFFNLLYILFFLIKKNIEFSIQAQPFIQQLLIKAIYNTIIINSTFYKFFKTKVILINFTFLLDGGKKKKNYYEIKIFLR
jgi:hypothetical protein